MVNRFLFILFLFFVFPACGPSLSNRSSPQSAVAYNDTVIAEVDRIGNAIALISKAIKEEDFVKAESNRAWCIQVCDTAIKALKKLGTFKGDESFQLAGLKYFNSIKKLYVVEWKEVIELLEKKAQSNYSNDDFAAQMLVQTQFDNVIERIKTKGTIYDDDFVKAQQQFASRYNFRIRNAAGDSATDTEAPAE